MEEASRRTARRKYMMSNGNYGKELILDLYDCDTSNMNEEGMKRFFKELCEEIDMEAVQQHFWLDPGYSEDHLIGDSGIQFIKTSNITIHTLTKMKRVYLNIFSCKDFNDERALEFSKNYFRSGNVVQSIVIDRI